MESYIVQLDFSAAFDRVIHSGLLFKLKSISVCGSVLSICRELLSNNKIIIDFIATRLQNTIGIIIKIQKAWLTGWQVIW